MKRFFKIVKLDNLFGIINNCYGRYVGKTPKQAANKAFTRLIKNKQKENKFATEILFCIKECTQNSKKRLYWYHGIQKKYDRPIRVMTRGLLNMIEVTYKHYSVVKKIKSPQIIFTRENND